MFNISKSVSEIRHSPILNATLTIFSYINENGPIALTAGKAFKRYFVDWAVDRFNWPLYEASELRRFNKVLNEADVLPLMMLHEVLLGTKVGRHYKGAFHITKFGKSLQGAPEKLWAVLAAYLLTQIDHGSYSRYGDYLDGDWNRFLSILDVEAENGVTEEKFASILFNQPEQSFLTEYRVTAMLYVHVLRPLCWAGLLYEHRTRHGMKTDQIFVKTPLWPEVVNISHHHANDNARVIH